MASRSTSEACLRNSMMADNQSVRHAEVMSLTLTGSSYFTNQAAANRLGCSVTACSAVLSGAFCVFMEVVSVWQLVCLGPTFVAFCNTVAAVGLGAQERVSQDNSTGWYWPLTYIIPDSLGSSHLVMHVSCNCQQSYPASRSSTWATISQVMHKLTQCTIYGKPASCDACLL